MGRSVGAEIAVVHGGSGHGGELQRMIDAAETFVIAEDEELVFNDGAACVRRRTDSD